MQRDAATKGVRLETVIDHGVGAIQGTAQCPRQVVASLVSNAIRATPSGGRVCVRVRRRRQEVELSVVDTGEGIAEPQLERIFLSHGPEAGSLARAREQVRLHGGEMTAFSAGPGTGATFTLRLQRQQLVAPAAREAVEQLAV
jgi:signal transduction histidine kinase